MAVIWLVLGVVLLLVELRHLQFYALFVAVGSFAAAVVALVAPSAIPIQVAVAVVVAIAGVWTVRPAISRAFHRHLGGQVARGVHGGLVGQEALTLDAVGSRHSRGHVRMTGERWLAVSGGPATIPANTAVLVTGVEGTTLVVLPVGASTNGATDALPPGSQESLPPGTTPGTGEGRTP